MRRAETPRRRPPSCRRAICCGRAKIEHNNCRGAVASVPGCRELFIRYIARESSRASSNPKPGMSQSHSLRAQVLAEPHRRHHFSPPMEDCGAAPVALAASTRLLTGQVVVQVAPLPARSHRQNALDSNARSLRFHLEDSLRKALSNGRSRTSVEGNEPHSIIVGEDWQENESQRHPCMNARGLPCHGPPHPPLTVPDAIAGENEEGRRRTHRHLSI